MTVSQVLALASADDAVELIVVDMSGTLHVEQEIIKGTKSTAGITAHNSDSVQHYSYFPERTLYNIVAVIS